MAEYAKALWDIARRMVKRYPNDTSLATKRTETAIRKLDEFNKMVADLAHCTAVDLVHEVRHEKTRAQRKALAKQNKPKVILGNSESVAKVCEASLNRRLADAKRLCEEAAKTTKGLPSVE